MPGKSVTTGKLGGGKNPNNNRTTGTIVPGTGNPEAGSARLPSVNINPPNQAETTLRRQHSADHINSDETTAPREKTGSDSTESDKQALDPVNMATGEYIYEDKDIILPDINGEYSLTRRYTGPAKPKTDRSLGKAWALSTDTYITEKEKEATVTMPDGKTAEYIKQNGRYTNKKSGTKKQTLEKTESGYIFRDNTKKIKYHYDKDGKITKKTDKNGNTTEYIQNEYGIEKIILPTGYTITFTRENMKIAAATDSTGRTVKYTYEKGLLTKVTRCDGTEIKYTYDGRENLKTITDAAGCTYLENTYDENHRIKSQKTADGRHSTCTYDEKNGTNTVTEKNGAVTKYRYDQNYDITEIQNPDGSSEKRKTDKYGNIEEITDRCGAATIYKYDIAGNLLMKKEPSGLITNYEYKNNCLIKTWDNTGRQTEYKYDENGNITEEKKQTDNTGKESITEYGYDGYGRITQKTENGKTTTYRYTGTFPYPVQETAPDGTETNKKYDAAGRLAEKTTGDITEKYTYTEYNKLRTYTDGEGNTTEYRYDRNWRLTEAIKPGQKKGEQYTYDSMDRIISFTDACRRKTIYKRNEYGDIIQITKTGGEEKESNAARNIYCMEDSITYEYDNCRRIIKKQTGKYGCEKYEYDSCGRITKKTEGENQNGYLYKRDKAGRITEVKDPYGNITDAYSYDMHGNVTKHIHSPAVLKEMAEKGGTAEDDRYPGDKYTYNNTGQMTSKKELLSITKEGTALYGINIYRYDTDGNITTETTYTEPQPDPDTIADSNAVQKTDRIGKTRKIQRKYDICGRLKEISDSEGAKATYEYDIHGRKTKETERQDNEKTRITEYKYNRCGKQTKQTILQKTAQKKSYKPELKRKSGNRFLETAKKEEQPEKDTPGIIMEETAYAYDGSGNMIKAIMSDGLVITYTYDESGRKTSVTASDIKNPAEKRENKYKYDSYGYMSEKTENGITTRYENDAFGNILEEKAADGGTAAYRYDMHGRCTNIITPEENRKTGKKAKGTTIKYDLCGRPEKITDPEGNILEENTYDSSGNLLTQKNADGNSIKNTYDAGGRLKYSVTAAGVRKEYTYDALGNKTAQSTGKEAIYYKTDTWGHITETKTAENIKETYEYDYMGSLTAATDGEGRRRKYHRDIRGNTDKITYADGSMETYTYDEAGRPVTKTHRSGKKERYSYDIFGNPVKIETGAEEKRDGGNEKYTYEYDEGGRIKSATGGGIKYTYRYDACGRLETKSACGRILVKYGYDLNGNKISETDVTGKTTHYRYDITDRLTAIKEKDKTLAEYKYTPCGKVTEIECGDIKTEYTYNPDGRKEQIKITVGVNIISDIKYNYDESGNCIKKAVATGRTKAETEYGYDRMGRLTAVNSPDRKEIYEYDLAGNRTSRTINGKITEKYRYNEENELLSVEYSAKDRSEKQIRKYTYDADGNMTSDGRGTYIYDSLNRMTEAVMEDGRKLTCRYDAEGLRHETEENGKLVKYIYSGREAVCEETDENITRYIRGNGRLVSSDSENARTYYHYACDSLGSITHVIAGNEFGNDETDDDVNGRILCSYEYDAFGNITEKSEGIANRYGFTGEILDDITDMYYLRARYYAPDIGRFTQADTYHGDGMNLYVYAGNNPVRYVDPSGHEKQSSLEGVSESGSNSAGTTFEGTIYRSVDIRYDPLEMSQYTINANHRYTESGVPGLYFSSGEKIVKAELGNYNVFDFSNRTMYSYDVKLTNMLDVSNPSVRSQLGISLDSIVGESYDVTHTIGRYAYGNGYNGIIAPSARADGGINIILFNAKGVK